MSWWRLPFPPWVALATVTIVFGVWGFTRLVNSTKNTLDFFQSFFASFGLFGTSLGAGGVVGVRPPWQLGVAAVLAASLTARAVLGLTGDRIRRSYIRRGLRGHVIVCGAGALGTRLAGCLDKQHDVVLIDIDHAAAGVAMAPDRYVWPLGADAALPKTLLDAGIRSAAELLAVTGDDCVNSRIVTAVQELSARRKVPSGLRVLVRVEEAGLTRFFEERHAAAEAGLLRVSPFSTNAVAARALLVDRPRNGNHPAETEPLQDAMDRLPEDYRVRLEMVGGNAPHLLLVGDHPFLDAVMLEALRRWRALKLSSGEGVAQPPIRVSLYGPGATERAERFRNRWAPEPQLLDLYSQDRPTSLFGAEEFDIGLSRLRGRRARGGRPGDHLSCAIVACTEELDSIALALGIGRALGDGVRVFRVSMLDLSTLDMHIQEQTKESLRRSPTTIKSVAELACDGDAIRSHSSGEDRLVDELVKRGRTCDAARTSVESLFGRTDLDVHTDPAWHYAELEVPILDALLRADAKENRDDDVPLDAFVAAGLAIDLQSRANLLAAAGRLIARGMSESAFAACCEYARVTVDWRELESAGAELSTVADADSTAAADVPALRVLELRRHALLAVAVAKAHEHLETNPNDRTAASELESCETALRASGDALRAASDGSRGAGDDLLSGCGRAAIFAGGADSMSAVLTKRLSELFGPREALLGAEHDEADGGRAERCAPAATLAGASREEPKAGRLLPRSERPQVLQGFEGVVLCSGSASGLSAVVAKAAKGYGIATAAYAPAGKGELTLHPHLRHTDGGDFGELEPLAMWTDILAAGISPACVGVIAIPGGRLGHSEILLARAIGAAVGWIDPLSEQLLPLGEMLPGGSEDILELPTDAMSIRALLCRTELPDRDLRDHLAQQAHAEYRAKQQKRKSVGDPALAPWERLLPLFKSSNLDQADDVPNKLAMIGLRILRKREGGFPLELNWHEVELLAEMEHGRYVVERLRAGWQQGGRDPNRRLSPYFKPWDDLGDEKEWDREAVRRIPDALDAFGYGVTDM